MLALYIISIVIAAVILFILQFNIRNLIKKNNEKNELEAIETEKKEYFERLKLISNCCDTNKDGSDNLYNTDIMQRSNDDYTNLFTHIPEVYLNRNIEKTEKQNAEQTVEEPIIEKTDIKESVEELNDVRKITIL